MSAEYDPRPHSEHAVGETYSVPCLHGSQSVTFVRRAVLEAGMCVPAGHTLHTALPPSAYVPRAHPVQLDTSVPSCAFKKVPGGHAVHREARAAALYVPGRHGVHVALLVAPGDREKVPLLHDSHCASA